MAVEQLKPGRSSIAPQIPATNPPGRHPWIRVLVLAAAVVLLASCAAGPNPGVGQGSDPAGFWLGPWHGFIAPVTFAISLFTEQVSVYEVANNGNWYDLGFIVGIASSLGGGSGASAGTRRRSKQT